MPLPVTPDIHLRDAPPVSATQPALVAQQIGKTIWIIDDSPTVRAVAALHLRAINVTVRPFGDGLEALMHLCQFPHDAPPLILLDLELPHMDGYKVARYLRTLPCCAQTVIVMISARNAVGDRLKSRLAGANDYLIKPFTYDTLLAVVLTYLGAAVPQTTERPV